jgi:hypothetical protein
VGLALVVLDGCFDFVGQVVERVGARAGTAQHDGTSNSGVDDDDAQALRAEGLDPDDPAVVAAIDMVSVGAVARYLSHRVAAESCARYGVTTMRLFIIGVPARCATHQSGSRFAGKEPPPVRHSLSLRWAAPLGAAGKGRLMLKANLVATLAVLIVLRARELVRTVALIGAVAVRVAVAIAGA